MVVAGVGSQLVDPRAFAAEDVGRQPRGGPQNDDRHDDDPGTDQEAHRQDPLKEGAAAGVALASLEEHRQIGVVVEALAERREDDVHKNGPVQQAGSRQAHAVRHPDAVDGAVLEQLHEGDGVVRTDPGKPVDCVTLSRVDGCPSV